MIPIWLLLLSFFVAVASPQGSRDLRLERADATSNMPDGRTRWAIVIGISKYKNVPPQLQLQFAHRDAEDFARFLRSPLGGSFPASHLRLLTDENATIGSIRAAVQAWLPDVAKPNDIVYIFFAGHGVIAEQNEGYFVAHDSDPQNLPATGLSFREVDQVLNRMRAGLVVLLADACHAGGIGWGSNPQEPSRAQQALEAIGPRDRSLLKLLASRPTERSYEDRKWDGGHGVFSYALLRGLRGEAERERDGVITASELIEYVSKVVPAETANLQNPRIAGNFEARVPLATTADPPIPNSPATVSLSLRGPAGAGVYIDDEFRGAFRPGSELRVDRLSAGAHRLTIDLPVEGSFEQPLVLTATQSALNLNHSPEFTIARIEGLIRQGHVLGSGGAWDVYRGARFGPEQKPFADAAIIAGLEGMGQECVSDYVQSTSGGLKDAMLVRAVEAYQRLRTLRPHDLTFAMKENFCQGLAQIARGRFHEAVESLRASLAIDPNFACAYNALGVAFTRLQHQAEARAAFEHAMRLAPQWSLPFLQLAQQHLSGSNLAGAVPYLEKAARFNPRSMQIRWTLARAYRLTGRASDFERQAKEMIEADPNYAPTYLELGTHYEAHRLYEQATQAFDTYLLLAPNYGDSAQVRVRAERSRGLATRRVPTLLRQEDLKKQP